MDPNVATIVAGIRRTVRALGSGGAAANAARAIEDTERTRAYLDERLELVLTLAAEPPHGRPPGR